MARGAFSPLRFFRQLPADLVHQYFESRGLIGDLEVDWPAGLCPQPETLAKAIADAPDKARGVIERDMRRSHAMANREGVAALLEQAVSHEEDWSARFGDMPSHQARALWAFVEAREIFDLAVDCSLMDRVGRWHHRAVPPHLDARCDDDARRDLLESIRGIYRRDGRDRHCHVDVYRRSDPERVCFHAFPEDYAESDLVFDDDGRLGAATRRPASEVIFVYRPREGLLELHAKGDAELRARLFDAFGQTVLSLDGMSLSDGLPRPVASSHGPDSQTVWCCYLVPLSYLAN